MPPSQESAAVCVCCVLAVHVSCLVSHPAIQKFQSRYVALVLCLGKLLGGNGGHIQENEAKTASH